MVQNSQAAVDPAFLVVSPGLKNPEAKANHPIYLVNRPDQRKGIEVSQKKREGQLGKTSFPLAKGRKTTSEPPPRFLININKSE